MQTPVRYAPYTGGVEVVAQVLAERCAAAGDHVTVICADDPPGSPTTVNGVRVRRLRSVAKVANTNITLGLPWALARTPYDVVHTHLPTPWSADISVLVAALQRRRSVVHFHNEVVGDGPAGWVARAYRATVGRLTLGLASAVVVISQSWYDELSARYPHLRGRLHLAPNGVDTQRFSPPPDPTSRTGDLMVVSVLDDFHAYKGVEVLLDALPRVPGVWLHVVGDGSRRPAFEAQAASLGVADRVVFHGRTDDAALLDLYRRVGLFVLPSRYLDHEGGSSLVALEALACGLPCVVAAGAGDIAAEVEQAGCGVRVAADDPVALAAAVQTLLEDPGRRAAMSARAREHVLATHSWEPVVELVRRLYRG